MQNKNNLWIRLGILIGIIIFLAGITLVLVSLGQQGRGPLAFLATPTPTPTATPTVTFTPTPTSTSTFTPTPTFTSTPTRTFTPTITLTPTLTFTPTSEFAVVTIHNHNCPTQDIWVDGKFMFNISNTSTKTFTILKGEHTLSACYIGTFKCGNLVETTFTEDTVDWTIRCIIR